MSQVKPWGRRPPEIANLYNPAFCAALLNRISAGYLASKPSGLPVPLAFLALPIALHPTSILALPTTARSNFHGWLLDNPEVLIGFADRAAALVPYTREAISFGLSHHVLLLRGGCLVPLSDKAIKRWDKEPYNAQFSRDTQLLGKLLSQVKDQATVFALFGVRP
jgi:hypothetical protein